MSKGSDSPEPQARERPIGRTHVNPLPRGHPGRVKSIHRNVKAWDIISLRWTTWGEPASKQNAGKEPVRQERVLEHHSPTAIERTPTSVAS